MPTQIKRRRPPFLGLFNFLSETIQLSKMIAAVQSTKATFFKATTAKASRKSTVIRAGAYDAELIQTAVRHIVLKSLLTAI